MLKSILSKVQYAILLFRFGGLKVFLRQVRLQIYSRATLIGLEKNLAAKSTQVPCKLEYTLRLASEEDMKEVLRRAKSEGGESARELLHRKWFYDAGFRTCYVARTADTGEICSLQWLVLRDNSNLARQGFKRRYPKLKEGEILLDKVFTFEKYRGNRIMPSVMVKLFELARSKGFEWARIYIDQNNTASLKGAERAGFKKFTEVPELKLLFFTKRKHGDNYSHPEHNV